MPASDPNKDFILYRFVLKFLIIRLEAGLQPNTGFTSRRVLAVSTAPDHAFVFIDNSTETRKWTNLDKIWSTRSKLSDAGPGRFWVQSAQ